MKMKRIAMLFCLILHTNGIHAEDYAGYSSLPVCYEKLETSIGNLSEASLLISEIIGVDSLNLASAGEREALEWTRKYLELYPPEAGKKIRAWGPEYLAIKGDERYVETVSQYDDDYGRLLATRIAGTNVFDSGDFGVLGYWGKPTFIPSVANTGPQAVYVREILYRYWEEHGRDLTKIPSDLLTITVSFNEDDTPVCSVDLMKYGLSMPVITPKPDKEFFNFWNEGTMWDIPVKLTVAFPDLAEPVEITPYMRERNSPDWKGLYIHVPKKASATAVPQTTPIRKTEVTPLTDTTQDTSPPEQPQSSPKNKNLLWLGILALAVISAVTVWRLIKRKR